ncbi:MAG TPA: hypothetical protein VKG82_02810 [Solirubrobacteraceae bacterium]|nr:hypothetical protein [Solirubrobacteraceae bacterium]
MLISGLLMLAGFASAQQSFAIATSPNCKIFSLPGLMRQGELANAGSVGDIVTVECNNAVYPGGTPVEISDASLESRCLGFGTGFHGVIWYQPNSFRLSLPTSAIGNSIKVELDGEGNATVALVAGPNCAVGTTTVTGKTEIGNGNTKVESFATEFAVETAKPLMAGASARPPKQVEDEGSSSVATLVQAEFPSTGAKVRIAASDLFARCELAPGGFVTAKVTWLRPNFNLLPSKLLVWGPELQGGTATEAGGSEALKTDNDGNAFAIAVGSDSCKPGTTFFKLTEEKSPFSVEEPQFTILKPEPTEF